MKYFIVDAFTDEIFKGNPAGVCVPEKKISEDEMQKIAFENNLSETAFILKQGEFYEIRWFTPKSEIDLCGHATLGSAFVISNFLEKGIKKIKLKSQSGELSVACQNGLFTLDFPVRIPKKIDEVEGIGEILHTAVLETYLSRDLLVLVDSEKTVSALKPDFEKLSKIKYGDGLIVTAKGDSCDFVSRFFCPKCGINEDPVTGSSHCNLIPYWASKLNKQKMFAKQLSERGGVLQCEFSGDRVKIGGRAALYLEGTIL